MEFFIKIVMVLAIFAESLILDICLGAHDSLDTWSPTYLHYFWLSLVKNMELP